MKDEKDTVCITTIDASANTITISLDENPSIGDIWLNNNVIQTYDINTDWVSLTDDNITIDIDNLTFPVPVEWEHEFPALHKVEEMCKEYPALEKAYENFKTIYKMVEQDYIGKKKDDEPPF